MESSDAPLSSVVSSVLWSPQSPFRSGALPRFASISRDVEERFRLEMHEGGSPSDSRMHIGQGCNVSMGAGAEQRRGNARWGMLRQQAGVTHMLHG